MRAIPVVELKDIGYPVESGVDISNSNDESNLIQKIHQAIYSQRLEYVAQRSLNDWH
jgi:3-dehydroquinate dehydratase